MFLQASVCMFTERERYSQSWSLLGGGGTSCPGPGQGVGYSQSWSWPGGGVVPKLGVRTGIPPFPIPRPGLGLSLPPPPQRGIAIDRIRSSRYTSCGHARGDFLKQLFIIDSLIFILQTLSPNLSDGLR